jgi:putative ATP-binding cassette transporter
LFRNTLAYIIVFTCVVVIALTLYFIGVTVSEIFRGKRKFCANGKRGFAAFFFSTLLSFLCCFCLYEIPQMLLDGFNWIMIAEIGPDSLIKAVIALETMVPVLYIYFLLSYYFTKPDDNPYFLIAILSILTGFGNSMMVFIVNEALSRSMSDSNHLESIESGLYVYFLLAVLLFTSTDYFSRRKLIKLTNEVIYSKRMMIIDKIFRAPYYNFERMERGKTFAALNNDPENVSNFVNMFVLLITGTVSLTVSFVYLGTLNGYGALLSIAIIVLASALFVLVSHSAEKVFEKNRDVQNLFFKNINDMVSGFKELYINRKKRSGFHEDINNSCKMYTDTRIEGDCRFVGVSILGNSLYMLVIGIVVFTFPVIFPYIAGDTLSSFVVVYLYMGGIITTITAQIPNLMRVIVSWRRINKYIDEISTMQETQTEAEIKDEAITVELKNVKFSYKNESGEDFTLGPINYKFSSGEIAFISGGNGSGKTTLAKLVTGLYQPDEGEILINGEKINSKTLGSYFTTVYSDFYLFDRLYGINCSEKTKEIDKYLEILRIKDKVSIKDDSFTTIHLSTGQRKRLALLISYLEDKPAFFFDEWAADQDPEFRKFFYTELLPELKSRGKAVIAITHDDRYFDLADRRIKMEMGKIVEQYSAKDDAALTV